MRNGFGDNLTLAVEAGMFAYAMRPLVVDAVKRDLHRKKKKKKKPKRSSGSMSVELFVSLEGVSGYIVYIERRAERVS
jgi:hypothetical protein